MGFDEQKGLVSVLVTVYNYGIFLLQCLNSIIEQDYKNFEIVIVDDYSTDDTFNIARKWIREHPEVKAQYIYLSENHGQSRAKNIALNNSSGEFVFFLDADNYFRQQNALQIGVDILNNKPEVGFVYSDRKFVGDRDDEFPTRKLGPDIFHTNYIDGNMLSRRVAFGEYDPQLVKFTDWDRVLHMVTNGWKGEHVPQMLIAYRFHNKNTGMVNGHHSAGMADYIMEKYKDKRGTVKAW